MMKLAILLSLSLIPGSLFAQSNSATKIEADVVYGHKDGLALTMDVFRPETKPNGAAVVFIVSGGWYSRWSPPEEVRPMMQPFLEKGYTVIAVRHGSSPRYSIPEAVSDVQRAIRFIRKNVKRFQIDADRIGVMGNCAGPPCLPTRTTMPRQNIGLSVWSFFGEYRRILFIAAQNRPQPGCDGEQKNGCSRRNIRFTN